MPSASTERKWGFVSAGLRQTPHMVEELDFSIIRDSCYSLKK